MKIFVTGATGFVGREIVKKLHAAGYSIRILARNPESVQAIEEFQRYGVEIQPGTLFDADALQKGVAGMNAVIHLVGIISEIRENTFEAVHTQGTINLITAVQQTGIERFVHMSALGTRADSESRYHQSKWLGEEAVRQSDLDYTILRPSLIFGTDDQFSTLFTKLIRFSPVIPILGNENAHFQPISVEDVATAFASAVVEPRSIGQIYDLCGPEELTLEEIVNEICAAMGRKRLKLRIPLSVSVKLAATLEFVFPRLLRKAPPLNREQLIMLQENNIGNPEPANQMFNLRPIRFRDGIRDASKFGAKDADS
jgi:uncharacterized protein YbjT (DUF2867 family)